MKGSAAESSSAVVTPGRILPSSSRSVRTRMSPAAAILATSSGVLRMITGESVRRSVVESGGAIVVPAKDAGRAQWRSHGPDRGRTQGRRGPAGSARNLRTGPLRGDPAHQQQRSRHDEHRPERLLLLAALALLDVGRGHLHHPALPEAGARQPELDVLVPRVEEQQERLVAHRLTLGRDLLQLVAVEEHAE